MITHGVATGSRWPHFRAKTDALVKNAYGNTTLCEL
jgi:hypothetical protein